MDLEAIEACLLEAMHHTGRAIFKDILHAFPLGAYASSPCALGHRAHAAGVRPRRLITILAPIQLHRRYYYAAECQRGTSPLDGVLDIKGTMFSPGVRAMMAYVGAKGHFREGQEDPRRLATLEITAKSITT